MVLILTKGVPGVVAEVVEIPILIPLPPLDGVGGTRGSTVEARTSSISPTKLSSEELSKTLVNCVYFHNPDF